MNQLSVGEGLGIQVDKTGGMRPSDSNGTVDGVPPLRVRQLDRFFDKSGEPISLREWAILRQDPAYTRVGYWEGEGGSWVYTVWLGLDLFFGLETGPAIFDTQISAFGGQPDVEWHNPSDTLERALALHDRVVLYVESGITPPYWELDGI